MVNKLSLLNTKIATGLKSFFSIPEVAALCQANQISAGISTYFATKYSQEQYDSLKSYFTVLNEQVSKLKKEKLETDFLDTPDGKRIIGKVFRSISRDARIEKLTALANLTVNLFNDKSLSSDEKEVYVDILDNLNLLQLAILKNAITEMWSRTINPHRGMGWELAYDKFASTGISKPVFLQSVRTLETNGLINLNTAAIQEKDKTHFVTDFGEQFYKYICTIY